MEITYHHHFTRDEVAQILRDAHTAVEDSDVPDDLQYAAFEKAVDLLGQKVGIGEQTVARPSGVMLPRH